MSVYPDVVIRGPYRETDTPTPEGRSGPFSSPVLRLKNKVRSETMRHTGTRTGVTVGRPECRDKFTFFDSSRFRRW